MSRIKSGDTKPEIAVRSILHKLGYRFRLHDRSLPGRPDIVLKRHRVVVFVHGCFWHRHRGCPFAYTPKSNVPFWTAKFTDNVARDQVSTRQLRRDGWRVLVVWECRLRHPSRLRSDIQRFFRSVKSAQDPRTSQP
ncbi:very short patch repair endonuclease [Luteitalea pratensis]|uniref:very short patch repair endonuclease n=1 Tax=Luteitalea pratensis TaxID=1855912 RepID=UPI003AAA3B7E